MCFTTCGIVVEVLFVRCLLLGIIIDVQCAVRNRVCNPGSDEGINGKISAGKMRIIICNYGATQINIFKFWPKYFNDRELFL